MPQLIFGQSDGVLQSFADVLSRYETEHPGAESALYRQNSASVRIRIIDPSFAGLSKSERSRMVWPYLRTLSEDVRCELTVLLLLVPEETGVSFANVDFDHPVPSTL